MPLPTGQIAMSEVNVELGKSSTAVISLNDADVRTLAQVASGQISMSNLQGKSNIVPLSKGYFAGGQPPGTPAFTSNIDGILFSNDTAFNPAATLADGARIRLGAFYSTTKGYFAGGLRPSPLDGLSSIDGILFSNDTAFNPTSTLTGGQRHDGGSVSSSSKGYMLNGKYWPGPAGPKDTAVYSDIVGVLFSNDTSLGSISTTLATASAVSTPVGYISAESSTIGYHFGSNLPNRQAFSFNFSNETVTPFTNISPGANISGYPSPTNPVASVSADAAQSPTLGKAYIAGVYGITPGPSPSANFFSNLIGFVFSNQTYSFLSVGLSDGARIWLNGTESTTKGYFAGGSSPASGPIHLSHIDGIIFSNETAFNPTATLTDAVRVEARSVRG